MNSNNNEKEIFEEQVTPLRNLFIKSKNSDNKHKDNKHKDKWTWSWPLFWVVMAILSFLYGIVVLLANSGTKFFLIWFLIGAFFACVALVLHKKLWRKIPKAVRVIFTASLSLGLVIILLTQGLVWSKVFSKGQDNLDVIVVLGSQVYKSGPSLTLRYRLDTAIDYLEKNPNTKVVVSGGQGSNEPFPEAEGMRDYLLANGIAEDRIYVENKSLDTNENIRFSAQFFDPENDSVGIVTNNFHVYRGVQLAKGQGYENVCGISAPSHWVYFVNNMLRESFGVVKDFVFGNF